VVEVVGFAGRSVSVVCGAGAASVIVHDQVTTAPTFDATSVGRTPNVCEPRGRIEYEMGDEHALYAAPSSEHWNVEGSFATKEKVAVVAFVAADGP
jgi:hypothetical protein